jgi:hypothetical protein
MKGTRQAKEEEPQKTSPTPDGWPEPLSAAAMRGLIGDIISTIGPESESDPAALALGVLAAFGNAIGFRPHFTVERTRHQLNLYTVYVGQTAKARKGTAWDHIATTFGQVDPEWAKNQIQSGLSSGEGLIAALAGAADRRLLFVEDEFTSVLRVMSRSRSTLSTTLRRAWDGKSLQIVTRANPVLVQGGHISLMGHTTIDDLERYLGVTDIVNGFANRVLWVCTRRSKLLPFGGRVSEADMARIVKRVKSALKFAMRAGEIGFSEKAARLWSTKYAELTADRPRLVGAATSRAEAQTRRVATIYALMDESGEVLIQHLKAALEVWRYCQQSAEYIFGRRQRKTIENEIVEMLRRANKKGVTRTEISNAFSRHRNSHEITAVLERLKTSGYAKRRNVDTDGRPAERWFLA